MRNRKNKNKKRSSQKARGVKGASKKKSKKPPFRPYGTTHASDSVYDEPLELSDLGDQVPREQQITEDIEKIELDLAPVSDEEKQEVKKILSNE